MEVVFLPVCHVYTNINIQR